jgi:hypothetical protein
MGTLRAQSRHTRAFLDCPIEGDWPYLWIDGAPWCSVDRVALAARSQAGSAELVSICPLTHVLQAQRADDVIAAVTEAVE